MATASEIINQMRALLVQANEATGKNDTDLTAAVASLVEGQGGTAPETCTVQVANRNQSSSVTVWVSIYFMRYNEASGEITANPTTVPVPPNKLGSVAATLTNVLRESWLFVRDAYNNGVSLTAGGGLQNTDGVTGAILFNVGGSGTIYVNYP